MMENPIKMDDFEETFRKPNEEIPWMVYQGNG
jgi:hypothetical protein